MEQAHHTFPLLKDIINKIGSLQSTGSDQYPAGLFPSQRVHTMAKYSREDNNIFFSALIVFTLQRIQAGLPSEIQPAINDIIEKVRANYPRYQHYADEATYNFWQDSPNGHFPNGYLLKKMPFFALPADADDTSMIYLTLPKRDGLSRVKEKLESHYTPEAPLAPLTLPAYADLKAYPTFLGKKIKRELDVCVISNVLYMVFDYGLPLSTIDKDSIELIRRVLHYRDYKTHPFHISPNYGSSAVILYHIARLVGSFRNAELLELEAPLLECLSEQLGGAHSFMETLLLKTSLLRFGIESPPVAMPRDWDQAFGNFYFFQAGMITGFQKPSLNKLASQSFFHLKYRCEAYYWTLWLEYLVLDAQSSSPKADLRSSSVDRN